MPFINDLVVQNYKTLGLTHYYQVYINLCSRNGQKITVYKCSSSTTASDENGSHNVYTQHIPIHWKCFTNYSNYPSSTIAFETGSPMTHYPTSTTASETGSQMTTTIHPVATTASETGSQLTEMFTTIFPVAITASEAGSQNVHNYPTNTTAYEIVPSPLTLSEVVATLTVHLCSRREEARRVAYCKTFQENLFMATTEEDV